MANVAVSKSGLKTLAPGEIIFNDGDNADSLYIIQKGQVRLFKPKGKGYIELAVLRTGEVIGEMAYFDEDGSGRKRSCSASAITPVEVIEISFTAFGKTMSSLNPWFKTIINTLATRLRRTNVRVKELEDNQAVNYGNKAGSYEFLKHIEVMRILGTIFLVFKAHGELRSGALSVNKKTLTLYSNDMYQIMDAKLESIMNLLTPFGWLEVREDEDKQPNLLLMKNVEVIRQIFIHYNAERQVKEASKLRVGDKCEAVIGLMLEKLAANPVTEIPDQRIIDDVAPKFTKYFNLNPIIEDFKTKNQSFDYAVLEDGKNIGLFGDVMDTSDGVQVEADMVKVQKMYPIIRFVNAVRRLNQEKSNLA